MRQILPRERTQTEPAGRHRIRPLLVRALVVLGILAVLGLGGMVAYVYLFPKKVARSTLESRRRSAAVVRKEIACRPV